MSHITRMYVKDAVAVTGNVVLRENGEEFLDHFSLDGADGGSFLDFSEPVRDTSSYLNTIQPGYMSRDCTLFVDDEAAYFISVARANAELHVYRLSEDYLNIESLVHKLWQGEYREAPAIIEHNNQYFMIFFFLYQMGAKPGKIWHCICNGQYLVGFKGRRPSSVAKFHIEKG